MTYSIVARCHRTGQLGMGVASHVLAVGRIVRAEAGVGVVATQAMALLAHGDRALAQLRGGAAARDALDGTLAVDADAALRQVAVVDAGGGVAAHTGERCIAHAGHATGDGWSAQSNIAADPSVWTAMGEAFESTDGPLAWRLLAALDAAEAAGGDLRGRQSAALAVVNPEPAQDPLLDHVVDVRVDDHPAPLRELRRLVDLGLGAYDLERAEQALVRGDLEEAVRRYDAVLAEHPEQAEYRFWFAVALAGRERDELAASHLRRLTARDDGHRWLQLLERLPAAGLLDADAATNLVDRLSSPSG